MDSVVFLNDVGGFELLQQHFVYAAIAYQQGVEMMLIAGAAAAPANMNWTEIPSVPFSHRMERKCGRQQEWGYLGTPAMSVQHAAAGGSWEDGSGEQPYRFHILNTYSVLRFIGFNLSQCTLEALQAGVWSFSRWDTHSMFTTSQTFGLRRRRRSSKQNRILLPWSRSSSRSAHTLRTCVEANYRELDGRRLK